MVGDRNVAALLLAASLATVACKKKKSEAPPEPPAEPTRPKGPGWPGPMAGRESKGSFDVTTGPQTTKAPFSGKECAHWSLFLEGKTSEKTRIFFDDWPRTDVTLNVDGKQMEVPILSLRWEAVPTSLKREYRPEDDAPVKVREMLTSKIWMDKEGPTPPIVIATERCLTASTTFRGEVKKEEREDMGPTGIMPKDHGPTISYYLVLAPK